MEACFLGQILALREECFQVKLNGFCHVAFRFFERVSLRVTTRQRGYNGHVPTFGRWFVENAVGNGLGNCVWHTLILGVASQEVKVIRRGRASYPGSVLHCITSRSIIGRQILDRSLTVAARKTVRTNDFRASRTLTWSFGGGPFKQRDLLQPSTSQELHPSGSGTIRRH